MRASTATRVRVNFSSFAACCVLPWSPTQSKFIMLTFTWGQTSYKLLEPSCRAATSRAWQKGVGRGSFSPGVHAKGSLSHEVFIHDVRQRNASQLAETGWDFGRDGKKPGRS